MNGLARIFREFAKIADYNDQAERAYRRLRGGSHVDNRLNAAERFIDERQYEAMQAVSHARLQQEAMRAARADGRVGGLAWVAQVLRRALNRSYQRDTSRPVPVRVEIRR